VVSEADLEPYLARVGDELLAHTLSFGVGLIHDTQPPAERAVVEALYAAGAIQVGWGGEGKGN
jgi:hypothetical protein